MKTQVTITLDEEVKIGLQKFARALGLNMSSLLNLSARKLISTQHLDFDLSRIETPENKKSYEKAVKNLENGKDFYTFKELKDV